MSLRNATIRLAYARPELRPHLLPLLARTAGTEEEMTVTAGRPWGGKGYSSKSKDYDDPSPGPGAPPCQPEGEGGCYDKHHEYGKANAGTNGSAARRKYNEWYRKNVEGV